MAAAEDDRPTGEDAAPSPYMVRDAEAFARNLARAVEEGGRALAAYLKPHEEGKAADLIADATTEVVKTLGRIGEYWTSDPARLMEAQTRLFASYFTIWQGAIGAAAMPSGSGAANSGREFRRPPLHRSRLEREPDVLGAEAALPRDDAFGPSSSSTRPTASTTARGRRRASI